MVVRSRIAQRPRLPPARMSRMATKWVNVESIGSYFESLSDPGIREIANTAWSTSS